MIIFMTGGAGFIGSHAVRATLAQGHDVVNFDAMTYAANPLSLADLANEPRYRFIKGDITDAQAITRAVNDARPDAVINFAAESHVDRSIDDPGCFVRTNTLGTQVLLDACRTYIQSGAPENFRILHVSTDEVFGSLELDQPAFTEESRYDPSSPYAASKASADHLCRAYHRTFGLPVLITNCGNNYGPCQFPEKLIPHMILCALEGKPLPIYGTGKNIRDWIYAGDHAEAVLTVLTKGVIGDTYLIGADSERTNIDLVHAICDGLDRHRPRSDGASYRSQIAYVADRPGHDKRYALDTRKIRAELGWSPKTLLEQGLEATLVWYLHNEDWIMQAKSQGYALQRIGTGEK